MENEQQTIFPSDGIQNFNPQKNTFQPEAPEGQNDEIKDIPEGYVYTEDEGLKQFYLEFASKIHPSTDPGHSELERLQTFYACIKKTCELLTVLDGYSWGRVDPLLIKACGFFMFVDSMNSARDKQKLNNLIYMYTHVMAKIAEFHDLITHDLVFFSRIKNDLIKMLNIEEVEDESG